MTDPLWTAYAEKVDKVDGWFFGHVPWSGVRAVACPRVALW
ncbi:hypothetical protein [Mycobacterium avium]|nr:hypothetical protein [Mycobacterium avium]